MPPLSDVGKVATFQGAELGLSWFRRGEEAEDDSTIGVPRKGSKAVTANDNQFAMAA